MPSLPGRKRRQMPEVCKGGGGDVEASIWLVHYLMPYNLKKYLRSSSHYRYWGTQWMAPPYCWFSHDVTKFQTSELLILLRFYFHVVSEQLKTNIHTNFHSEWVLGLVIDYAWTSKLLRDVHLHDERESCVVGLKQGRSQDFSKGGSHWVIQRVLTRLSPEYCGLSAYKKAYKGGVTGTPGPPLATPLV